MKVKFGWKSLDLNVDGDPVEGSDEVLAFKEDDLTRRRRWHTRGYTVNRFLPEGVFLQFLDGTKELFVKYLHKAGLEVDSDFSLKNYHKLVKGRPEVHHRVLELTQSIPWVELPVHYSTLEERITEITSVPVDCRQPETGERTFSFHIVLPREGELSPIYRDAWNPAHKGAVTIQVPVSVGPLKSSMLLAPGSHLWPESDLIRTREEASVNGIVCGVPGLISCKRPLAIKRPSVGLNRVIVCSSYLLHGGIVNSNRTFTHVSLEMHFWRRKFGH